MSPSIKIAPAFGKRQSQMAWDFAMSENSPDLVLQLETRQKP